MYTLSMLNVITRETKRPQKPKITKSHHVTFREPCHQGGPCLGHKCHTKCQRCCLAPHLPLPSPPLQSPHCSILWCPPPNPSREPLRFLKDRVGLEGLGSGEPKETIRTLPSQAAQALRDLCGVAGGHGAFIPPVDPSRGPAHSRYSLSDPY